MATVRTDIPARMDRLPWARWHWMVLLGLGTVWILDGLEVTIVGALAERLTEPDSGLVLTDTEVGAGGRRSTWPAPCSAPWCSATSPTGSAARSCSCSPSGCTWPRPRATAFSFDPWFFLAMRFLTGAGIGGEYAAINSAIDELVPARVRGHRVDSAVNGSYWAGAGGRRRR